MSETLLYATGVIVMALGIALSIALHEVGHLLPAKLFGVKVTQFMVGFGKTLFSKRRGETEYGIKLIPLGGYVAMIGMYPPAKPGAAPRAGGTGFLQTLERKAVAPARVASAETVGENEAHRTFYGLPVWRKIVIMAGGPLVNLLLGFVFFAVLISGIGVQQPSTTVGSVVVCLKPAAAADTGCAATDPAAPAAAAGILPGDRLLAIDGTAITSWEDSRTVFGENPGTELTVLVKRGGAELTLTVTPQLTERVVLNSIGQPVKDGDSYVTETVGVVGLSPAYARRQLPITAVPEYVWQQVTAVTQVILNLPQRLAAVWDAAFGQAERDPEGPLSVVGVGRLAGEIASLDQTSVLDRVSALVGLLAGLNIALFVFNLIPLVPLDGGHIAGALYEGAKRKLCKLLGRGDPGPVDTAKMVPVTLVMVALFGAMSLLLIYADIVKPITLSG